LNGAEPGRPLAILCGGGGLALEAARWARLNGREVFLVGIVGSAGSDVESFPHVWLRLGELGKLFAALREREIVDVAILGSVRRPEFSDLKLDWGAVARVGEIARLFRGGDNSLLAGVARLLEREGLRVVGVRDYAPQLRAPAGVVAGRAPEGEAESDIAFGAALLRALSPFDVGQGAVVANGRVLAIEAAEGTDEMLARVARMRASGRLRLKGRAGVFVKAAKRGQDMRLDLPAVGLETIASAANAELSGIAIAAGEALIADRSAFAASAEKAALFVFGWTP